MQVNGLNHVNIVTADMARTLEFYEKVLGMHAHEIPIAPGNAGRWISDSQGAPIIHVQPYDPERHGALPEGMGTIDHVALTCVDFDAMTRHCEELGIDYRVNDRQFGGIRQVFVTDPNNIPLELNFGAD